MARIGTFEMLIQRIAPGPESPLNRLVVTGYFLTVSNPNNRPVGFNISATYPNAPAPAAGSPETREITPTNHDAIWDVVGGSQAGQTVFSTMGPAVSVWSALRRRSFFMCLGAHQTGLFTLLPRVRPPGGLGTPLEVRGYIDINQVVLGTFPKFEPRIDLLCTAETRGTFIDNRFDVSSLPDPNTDYDFDQIAYSLPNATAGSSVTLESAFGPFFPTPFPFPERLAGFGEFMIPELARLLGTFNSSNLLGEDAIEDPDGNEVAGLLRKLPRHRDRLGKVMLTDDGVKKLDRIIEKAVGGKKKFNLVPDIQLEALRCEVECVLAFHDQLAEALK